MPWPCSCFPGGQELNTNISSLMSILMTTPKHAPRGAKNTATCMSDSARSVTLPRASDTSFGVHP
jgi:Na+-translocating ferredoxin:NAD+ oxidoreductase RNF subunit RnfB